MFCEKCGHKNDDNARFCEKCGHKNDDNARFCEKCGAQLATINTVKRPTVNNDITSRAQFAYNQKYKEAESQGVEMTQIIEAKLFAQAVELLLLKTPATARFSSLDEMVVSKENDVYKISGYVDSQNSYGAYLRTPYIVTAFKENGMWKDADIIVSTESQIKKKMASDYIVLYIIISIITAIGGVIGYFVLKAIVGF